MSSLRNALPRRAHKERAQPQARKKFEHVEKHKDYVVRAKAYHNKEQALQKIERLAATLHSLDNQSSKRHVFYAEDREEAKEVQLKISAETPVSIDENLPDRVKRKTAASYRELEARKSRVNDLEKLYMDMSLKKELQKKCRKRKLCEEEIVCPTSKPVYKW